MNRLPNDYSARGLADEWREPSIRSDEAFASWTEWTDRTSAKPADAIMDALVILGVLVIVALGAISGAPASGPAFDDGQLTQPAAVVPGHHKVHFISLPGEGNAAGDKGEDCLGA
ncbi:hypothetical protein ACFQU1_14980 [Chelatococcus sp. GCM10030263]|uniref:hypothetical protein n=1 Tax=Chelatococcus sp. GCM10030263 TaxID=3273387 RepID=UPI003613F2A2